MITDADPALGQRIDLPKERLAEGTLPPDVAYQLIHDELLLDGSARLNLATFVTTWMEPQARQLMSECADKNMIDKDEYPQTAELERRCVAMLADLWHAPLPHQATGCSTTGSSEACMLAGMALHRRWARRVNDRSRRPNLVMGANVQVCWEKFCRYWDVGPRIVPMEGDRFHLDAQEAVAHCDGDTIGVVAILGSTFDGSYEPVAEIAAALDQLAASGRPGRTCSRRWRVWRDDRPLPGPRAEVGLFSCVAWRRSTPQATSTDWSTRAWAGSCGATRRRCPRSWSLTSTTWAATSRPSP